MSVANVLREAKALIDSPEKWWRGPGESRGHTCMLTALPPVDHIDVEASCFEYLVKVIGGLSVWDVVRWNDAPERTHDEVMAAFDRAIALAEAEGAR